MHAVPAHARAQVAEGFDVVPTGDEVQDGLERRRGQIAVGVSPAHQVEERGHLKAIHRHAGDDLLGQHVEAA